MPARAVVGRAALAGLVAGLVSFVFAYLFAEPLVQAAIDYEEERGAAEEALEVAAGGAPAPAEAEVFSRTVQETIGIATGMVVASIALALLFAVVYTVLQGRVTWRPRTLALLLAGAGFVTFYGTPFLKYPANPPAVGNDDTIGDRSGLFLVMVVGCVLFLVVAVVVARAVRERVGGFNAALVGGLTYVVLAGILMAVLPSLGDLAVNVASNGGEFASETPRALRDPAGNIVFPGFDPDVLYSFRLYSFAAQLMVWGLIGLVFGALAERYRAGERSDEPAEAVSA